MRDVGMIGATMVGGYRDAFHATNAYNESIDVNLYCSFALKVFCTSVTSPDPAARSSILILSSFV